MAATQPAVEFAAALQVCLTNAGIAESAANRLGAELLARHQEPVRRYHTAEHVLAVLDHLDALAARTVATELAAFFHDAIYDPTATDNEERSADLADAWLVGPDLVAEVGAVATIVRATAGHLLPEHAPAGCAEFLDADLAILGADPAAYDRYAGTVRVEYSHVADADFRRGRATVLQHFLERDALYFTAAGRDRWEATARANLTRELTALI